MPAAIITTDDLLEFKIELLRGNPRNTFGKSR